MLLNQMEVFQSSSYLKHVTPLKLSFLLACDTPTLNCVLSFGLLLLSPQLVYLLLNLQVLKILKAQS